MVSRADKLSGLCISEMTGGEIDLLKKRDSLLP